MALKDNELKDFPSEAHRIVCEKFLLCNPDITTRDILSSVAKKIADPKLPPRIQDQAWQILAHREVKRMLEKEND